MSCNPFDPNLSEWNNSYNRSIIVVVDRGHAFPKYVGANNTPKNFNLFRIDGYLIVAGNKCDYLLIGCTDKTARFIELKCSDLEHAALQIINSINQLSVQIADYTLHARIVMNKTPTTKLLGTNYKKLHAFLKGRIVVRTKQMDENI